MFKNNTIMLKESCPVVQFCSKAMLVEAGYWGRGPLACQNGACGWRAAESRQALLFFEASIPLLKQYRLPHSMGSIYLPAATTFQKAKIPD
jgi:hypothetical protein